MRGLIVLERKCEACKGTGRSEVKQPTQPGRRIYPAKCTECAGKGRIRESAD
jgi:DnaJ-class molecular chaperone